MIMIREILLLLSLIFLTCIPSTSCISLTPPIVYVDTDGSGNFNCDGTNDHIELNQALIFVADDDRYTTVHLNGPNTYWIGNTVFMGDNTILEGDSDATIKLIDEADLDYMVPMIENKPGSSNNFTIRGFKIDGNSENQSVSQGSGYHNMMYFKNCYNVTVTDMRLEWGKGDGLKVEHIFHDEIPAYVTFTNNSVYKLGHDALYTMRLDYIIAADNDVFTRSNTAFRLSGSGNAKIYNNTIHSEYAGWSTGPGIQLDKGSHYISENVEIYNNTFHTLNGAGIWLTGEDKDDVIRGKNVHIHHNIFHNVGQYWSDTGYSNAAITIGQFNNTIIENNVIDDGGHAGIKYYIYHNYHMNTQFTTIVRN
ncbi:MAG: Disaggregatase related/Right handed beta helix region, partial [Candidatus Methanomarinus sp.]